MNGTTLAGLIRRSPWGLAGMVVLVLLVERALGVRALGLSDVDDCAFRWTGQAASAVATKAGPPEIVCFGDSLVKLSVVPSVVAERTGKRVYNLALSGSQATTSYFVLKRLLDAGGRPEAVVVDFNPPLLRVGPRHNLNRWGALVGPIEAARLAWWSRDALLFGQVTLDYLIPSLRRKSTIRGNLMDALAGRKSINPTWNGMAIRNWEKNDGAQLMVGSGAASHLSPLDVTRLREGYYPEWACDPANRKGIDRFLRLADRHGIRVFWLLAPVIPALHEEIGRAGIDAQHEAFARSWQAKYPGVVVLDARRKVVDPEAFWDPQHLSIVGASAFSRTLGDVLRRSISGKADRQWVTLPEVKVGPLAPGLENIEESRLAVEEQARAVEPSVVR